MEIISIVALGYFLELDSQFLLTF